MAADNEGVDMEALSRLRPGAPASVLQAALGKHWSPPLPDHAGFVFSIRDTHHFIARIDLDGIVGAVSYFEHFDAGLPIDGLRMGMSLEEVRAIHPEMGIMTFGGEPTGWLKPSDHMSVMLIFASGRLTNISIEDRRAVFWDKGPPPPYPAMAGEPGAPFKDPNLKLIVLSDLLDRDEIDLGKPEHLAEHVLQRRVNLEDEGYDLIPEAYEYLVRYPLDAELLAKVRRLYFGTGSFVDYVYPFWDGETDEFNVRSLEGIEHCVNLEEIHAGPLLDRIDLRQILALPRLRHLEMSSEIQNLDALIEMPALEVCQLMGNEVYAEVMTPGHPTRRIMETLKARGVKVRVHWMSSSGYPGPPAYE
jgi:uncharacterized protein DUF6892